MKNIRIKLRGEIYSTVSSNAWAPIYNKVRHVLSEDDWRNVHNNITHNIRLNEVRGILDSFAGKEL